MPTPRYGSSQSERQALALNPKEEAMKVWKKPSVREQQIGIEVTSYLPAEIDLT